MNFSIFFLSANSFGVGMCSFECVEILISGYIYMKDKIETNIIKDN